MLNLSPILTNSINSQRLTLAWCWEIIRADGRILRFTSSDRDLIVPSGQIYRADTGFDPTGAAQIIGSDSDSQQLGGFISSIDLVKEDLEAKLYDGAKIRAFIVDVLNASDDFNANPLEHIPVFSGIIATVAINDRYFEFEVKGLEDRLKNQIGINTSKFCRANFGDLSCGIDLTAYTHNVTVIELSANRRQFRISGNWQKEYFSYGIFTVTSGDNLGAKGDIFYSTETGWLTIFEPLFAPIEIGSTLEIVAGCPKTWMACVKYKNWLNFQGEPHIPLPEDRQNITRSDS